MFVTFLHFFSCNLQIVFWNAVRVAILVRSHVFSIVFYTFQSPGCCGCLEWKTAALCEAIGSRSGVAADPPPPPAEAGTKPFPQNQI